MEVSKSLLGERFEGRGYARGVAVGTSELLEEVTRGIKGKDGITV